MHTMYGQQLTKTTSSWSHLSLWLLVVKAKSECIVDDKKGVSNLLQQK